MTADPLLPHEEADGKLLEDALARLVNRRVEAAVPLLEQIVAHAPHEYPVVCQEGDQWLIRFWDRDEFLYYVTAIAQPQQQKVVWISNVYPRAFYYLGFVRVALDQPAAAIAALDRGLALEPTHPLLYCEKGNALARLSRHAEALAVFRAAEHCRPWLLPRQRGQILRGQGFQLIELDELDEAERCFHESLQHEPGNEIARSELQYIAGLRRGGPRAEKQLTTVRTDPEDRCTACGGPLGENWQVVSRGGRVEHLCTACQQQAAPPDKAWWRFWK